MKCICPFSNMEWKAEGFATGHHALVHPHPIFSLPLKYLVTRISSDWYAGRLNEEEKTLLFLATLKQTELVVWDVAAMPALAVVEQNIEGLAKLAVWQAGLVTSASSIFPSFRISKQTADLDNFHFWMVSWWKAKDAFEAGYRAQKKAQAQAKLEYFLESKLKNIAAGLATENSKFLTVLANWADLATSFPAGMVPHPLTGQDIRLSDYWKELICLPESQWRAYPLVDWRDLEDHIIDNIDDLSSTFGLALLRKLRSVQQKSGVDMGIRLIETGIDTATGKRNYASIEEITAAEQASREKMISLAPATEPKQQDYKSTVAFLIAKVRWAAKMKAEKEEAAGQAPVVIQAPTTLTEEGI